jgi:two-component system, response regulator PdtaR
VKKISELDAYELIWLHATQKRLTMAEIAVSIMNWQETLGGLGVPPTPMQTSSSPPVEQ